MEAGIHNVGLRILRRTVNTHEIAMSLEHGGSVVNEDEKEGAEHM